jgi:urease accessory protein
MLRFNEVLVSAPDKVDGVLTLTFDQRRKSRLLAKLEDGREAALMLLRGTILHDGEHLRGEGGVVVVVRAAAESLSIASTADAHLLTRAAYHLGNRHVPLQIGADFVAYAHDHVLDDMVRGLGLTVASRLAAFEPEAGAFAHDHANDHVNVNVNDHDHVNDHGADHVHVHVNDHGTDHAHGHGHGHEHGHGDEHGPGHGDEHEHGDDSNR